MGELRLVAHPGARRHDLEQRTPFRGRAGRQRRDAARRSRRLIVQLNEGRLADGSALIKAATARALTTVVTPIPFGAGPPELRDIRPNFSGYGLGFGLRDYRGHKLVTHTGGLPGYVSKVAMIPARTSASRCSPTRNRPPPSTASSITSSTRISERRRWTGLPPTTRWKDRELRADAFVTFALTPDGGIDTIRMRAVSPETDFSFDFQDLVFRPLNAGGR